MRKSADILGILILALLVVGFGPSSLKQGRKHLEREEYTQALEVLTDALNEDPDNPKIHRDLGIAYYKTDQYEQALAELNKAKEELEKDGEVIFYLGLTYERLGQYDEAIEAYSNYVRIGRFKSIKQKIEKRIQWLIQQQAAQWIKERMEIEEKIEPASIPDNSVGVTYFKPFSVSEKLEPLHLGLTDLLIIDLSLVESLIVLERIKLRELYNELGLATTDVVDQSTAPRLGKLLGANSIVTGTFTGFGNKQWRIDPALGSVKVGELRALEALEGEIPNFLQTEKQLVIEILRSLGIEVTQEEQEKIFQNIPTESLEAFLAYSRGLGYEDKGMYEEAAKEFETAASIDPEFQQAKDHLGAAKLLSQPIEGIGELETSWNLALDGEKGKDVLMGITIQNIAQGDVNRTPVSDMKPGRQEIDLEVLIQW
jgi:tetratricopeptide (TPR) repeat protein